MHSSIRAPAVFGEVCPVDVEIWLTNVVLEEGRGLYLKYRQEMLKDLASLPMEERRIGKFRIRIVNWISCADCVAQDKGALCRAEPYQLRTTVRQLCCLADYSASVSQGQAEEHPYWMKVDISALSEHASVKAEQANQ